MVASILLDTAAPYWMTDHAAAKVEPGSVLFFARLPCLFWQIEPQEQPCSNERGDCTFFSTQGENWFQCIFRVSWLGHIMPYTVRNSRNLTVSLVSKTNHGPQIRPSLKAKHSLLAIQRTTLNRDGYPHPAHQSISLHCVCLLLCL